RFAERIGRRFRRAVGHAARKWVAARQTADVDDVAAAAAPKVWNGRLAAIEEPGEVGVHDTPPVVVPLRLDIAEPSDASVVDENVDAALAPCGFVDERL